MKAWILLAAAMAATSAPARANMPAELASDPLMKQILAKQITQVNGGITAAVLVRGSKTGIDLALGDEASAERTALAEPAPVDGLVEKPKTRAKAKRPVRRADAQLAVIDEAGSKASWDKSPR